VGHRVLARRDRYLCPGVIRAAYDGNSVSVLFDGEEQPLLYHDLFSPEELDAVVADSAPATSQVSVYDGSLLVGLLFPREGLIGLRQEVAQDQADPGPKIGKHGDLPVV